MDMGTSESKESKQWLFSYGLKKHALPCVLACHGIKHLNIVSKNFFIITDSSNRFWCIGRNDKDTWYQQPYWRDDVGTEMTITKIATSCNCSTFFWITSDGKAFSNDEYYAGFKLRPKPWRPELNEVVDIKFGYNNYYALCGFVSVADIRQAQNICFLWNFLFKKI